LIALNASGVTFLWFSIKIDFLIMVQILKNNIPINRVLGKKLREFFFQLEFFG